MKKSVVRTLLETFIIAMLSVGALSLNASACSPHAHGKACVLFDACSLETTVTTSK